MTQRGELRHALPLRLRGMTMDTSAFVVLAFSTAAILSGWWIFEHVRLPKPDLGVFSLGDVGFMLVAVAVVPPLYLAIPTPVVAGILLLVLEAHFTRCSARSSGRIALSGS